MDYTKLYTVLNDDGRLYYSKKPLNIPDLESMTVEVFNDYYQRLEIVYAFVHENPAVLAEVTPFYLLDDQIVTMQEAIDRGAIKRILSESDTPKERKIN